MFVNGTLLRKRATSHMPCLPSHGGHGLHTSVSRDGPSSEQSFPPFAGRGLLQYLALTLNPVEQVLLHELHDDQALYPPWTS